LALGIANFAPPLVYAFMASVVGVLGSFMTSSNLSSNILFGSLQESTASTLGLSQEVILAAQTAGAAVGNAFAPGNVLMAATATGIQEKTGAIIRLTTGYVLLAGGLVGLLAVLGAWFALGGP
jgi:lactate permease